MERKRVNSAKIRSVGYDERNQILEIQFSNGEVLQYLRVSHDVYRGLMAAPMPGVNYPERSATIILTGEVGRF